MLAECLICNLLYLYSAFAQNVILRNSQLEDAIPCDKDWFLFKDKCYKLEGKKRRSNWHDALDRCKKEGATLATIYSEELNEFLVTFLVLDAKTEVWIGLNDQANETIYTWLDGTPFEYSKWDPKEPWIGRSDIEDCVEVAFAYTRYTWLNITGVWNDVVCSDHKPFICQKAINKNNKKSPDPRFCPGAKGGWKYQDSCYNIITEKMSWEDAEQYCQDKFQGHLVTVLDYTVDLFLNHIVSIFNSDLWIGIKLKEKFQQKWTSGWYVGYNDWTENPRDYNEDYCVLRSKLKQWTIAHCSKKYSFICERSYSKPPVLTQSVKGAQCPYIPDDWRDLDGDYCYSFHTDKEINWYQANFECMRRGGSLASIHSSAESTLLHPFVKYTRESAYIGLLRSAAHENEFVWSDGSNFNFTNWDLSSNEPNDKNERCGELRTRHMKWNDKNCNDNRAYVCTTRKISPNATEKSAAQVDCSDGTSLKVLITVSVCILLVVLLLAVIFKYLRPFGRPKPPTAPTSKIHPPIPVTERPRYSTREISVKEDAATYEDMH